LGSTVVWTQGLMLPRQVLLLLEPLHQLKDNILNASGTPPFLGVTTLPPCSPLPVIKQWWIYL
jgi:hypothetical protein